MIFTGKKEINSEQLLQNGTTMLAGG